MIKLIILALLIILLQTFLSRLENKWFGLLLPIISLIGSSLPTIAYVFRAKFYYDYYSPSLVVGFVGANVFTLILFGIYFLCRKTLQKNDQLKKISIQDL